MISKLYRSNIQAISKRLSEMNICRLCAMTYSKIITDPSYMKAY